MVCQTQKIDSNIVGLRFAEEECIGVLPQVGPATPATGLLSLLGQPTAGNTITIGTETYTFVSTTPGADEIEIGATVADTVDNIIAELNGGSAVVTAAQGPGNSVALTAVTAGVAGNSIATTSVGANLVFGAATLQGGAAPTTDPVWHALEPNSFTDFGAEVTTAARNPINPSRQRQKGVVVDLDASGSFNQDLTHSNAQQLLQGFLFADFRLKGDPNNQQPSDYVKTATAGDLTVTTAGNFATIESTTLDFTTLGLVPGEWIFVGGDTAATQFANEENNGFKRVRSISENALVIDKSEVAMVDDAGTGKTIMLYLGRVLKNESDPSLIKRRTYQLERTLGSLDGLDPPQSEYLVGAVPSELVINVAQASIVTADYTFIATDAEQRTQAQGLKPGTRPDLVSDDAFNSTSDLSRIRLALAGTAEEAPDPLFGFATEMTITINNSLSANKALGKLGAFDVTAGNLVVSGTLTVYFSDIRAVSAVRNNEDITLDMAFVKDNKGVVIDMPLIALGDGRPNVELDQAIMLPITADAAAGAKIDPALNHTILYTFFDQLPDLAAA